MFNFSKKGKKPKQASAVEEDKKAKAEKQEKDFDSKIDKEIAIHTMPSKFHIKKIEGSKKAGSFLFVILGSVLFLAVIGIGSYLFYIKFYNNDETEKVAEQETAQQGTKTNQTNNNTNITQKVELEIFTEGLLRGGILPRGEEVIIGAKIKESSDVELVSVDFGTPENYIKVENEPFSINITVSEDYDGSDYVINVFAVDSDGFDLHTKKTFLIEELEEEEEEEETEEGEETATSTVEEVVGDDADDDGLLDEEEKLLGTEADNVDTDGDRYKDGEEVFNLYNPNGLDRLVDNENMTQHINKMFSYNILMPKIWTKKVIGGDDSWIFKIDDDSFIQIVVQQNTDNKEVEEWYKEQFEGEEIEEDQKIESATWNGIITKDSLTAYLTDKDKNNIFAIAYKPKEGEVVKYANIFRALINSFGIF